jgi:DNA replication protein DnaC
VVRDVRRYVDSLEQRLEEGRGIWFQGDVGTGKTTLAMLISSEALRHGHSVAIYSLPRLLGMLRETFNEDSETSLSELLDRLAAVELLHIDDVGAEQSSPWVLEQLYERTVSRIIEMCGDPLMLCGTDQRVSLQDPFADDDEPLPYGAPRARPLAS